MNFFFCRNFLLFSALRIMLFTLFMVTFQNFPVLQITMIFIFCIPYGIITVYNIAKRKFIVCRIKAAAYLIEEVSLIIVILSAMVLIYLNKAKDIKLSQIRVYSTVIAYTVIIAVIVEVISIVAISIRDFVDWWKKRKNQKKEQQRLDSTSKLEDKTISQEDNIFENQLKEKAPLRDPSELRNQTSGRNMVVRPKQDHGELIFSEEKPVEEKKTDGAVVDHNFAIRKRHNPVPKQVDKFQASKAMRVNLSKEYNQNQGESQPLGESKRNTRFALKKPKEPEEGDEL